MSTPEIIPEQPRAPEVQPRVEQPIVPETQQQLGVSAPPQAPQPVVSENNQIIAQPVATEIVIDQTPSLSIPVVVASSEQELEKGAHGPADLSVTWLDMYWLREMGKAITKGWKVIFGQK